MFTPLLDANLKAYLNRIGLETVPTSRLAGLEALLRAHRLTIAFENFDIPLGRGISLDPDIVFDKLVTRRRGGYCFEQNQLFARVLAGLGFSSKPLLARVWLGIEPPDVPPRTHTLLLVNLGGETWIADAGFGDGFTPLMPLRDGAQAESGHGVTHRLTHGSRGWCLARNGGAPEGSKGWIDQYSFTVRRAHSADLAQANHWTSTHASARHASAVIAGRVIPQGRLGLYGRDFSRNIAGEKSTRTLTSAQDMHGVLATDFGISLPAEDVTQLFEYKRP